MDTSHSLYLLINSDRTLNLYNHRVTIVKPHEFFIASGIIEKILFYLNALRKEFLRDLAAWKAHLLLLPA